MFTLYQIKSANTKVKSGADFPRYFQDIKSLSVRSYETYVRVVTPSVQVLVTIRTNQNQSKMPG